MKLATTVLVAGSLVAALAVAAPAQATFPGRNGRIAFTASEWAAQPWDPSFAFVVSIKPDGSDPRILAGRKAGAPVYRPDGHMIAFTRYREVLVEDWQYDEVYDPRDRGIFVMRANGSGKRRLIAGPYTDPDWAPDSRRLVLTRSRKPRGILIWRGGHLRRLTSGSNPAWSPTGRLIAFTREDRPQPGRSYSLDSIYLIRPDGSGVRRLGPGEDPEWSPDGRRITFTRFDRPRSIYSIRPNRSGLRRVARFRGRDSWAWGFTVSPNGTHISYVRGFAGAPIWVMRAKGSRQTRIFNPLRWADLPNLGATTVANDLDWQPLQRRGPSG